jgi:hypothetical protein
MKTTFECSRCGLLKSTVEATGKKCLQDMRMGTTLVGVHDFKCSQCKKSFCEHFESDFDRFIKTPNKTLAGLLEGAEKRFTEEYEKAYGNIIDTTGGNPWFVTFLRQELIKAFEAGRPTELSIGQLRQFLNERDWSKQITNEEIKIWLQ